MGDDALAGIEEQMKREVGEDWEREVGEDWAWDDEVLRGRNAVRREHGLPGLGGPGDRPTPSAVTRLPLWRRLLKR